MITLKRFARTSLNIICPRKALVNSEKFFCRLWGLFFFLIFGFALLGPVSGGRADDPDAPPLESITFALYSGSEIPSLGYLIAQEKGYYAEEGLPPVKLTWLADDSLGASEHVAGNVHFSTVWTSHCYRFFCNGSDIVTIAQVARHPSSSILIQSDRHPDVDTLYRLPGHQFGIYFRWEENAAILKQKLDLTTDPVYFKSGGLMLLRQGVIDALYTCSYLAPVNRHFSRYRNVTKFFPLEAIGLGMPEDAISCSKSFLFQYPEICQKFVRASFRGQQTAVNDRAVALDTLKRYSDKHKVIFDETVVSRQLDEWAKILDMDPGLERNGELPKAEFNNMRELMIDCGLIRKESALGYEEFFYPVMRPETIERIRKEAAAKEKPSEPPNAVDEPKPETTNPEEQNPEEQKPEETQEGGVKSDEGKGEL